MAQQSQQRAVLNIAPRVAKPSLFQGTEIQWRTLCDAYPAATTPEAVMMVVEYCAARNLNPYTRPVHLVPMWSAQHRRKVLVPMQSIDQLEAVAHRTKAWAGMEPPKLGPTSERTFTGRVEDDSGGTREVRVIMRYPEYAQVTVYRMVAGEARAFHGEPVFWEEYYSRMGRTEVPNARWQQAPRQMLIKCAKAAALRAAFPEVGAEYVAEEMENKEADRYGVTIDGVAEQPPPPEEPEDMADPPVTGAFGGDPDGPPADEPDELRRILDEIATMDRERAAEVAAGKDADFAARVKDLFPPDQDRVRTALKERRYSTSRGVA